MIIKGVARPNKVVIDPSIINCVLKSKFLINVSITPIPKTDPKLRPMTPIA